MHMKRSAVEEFRSPSEVAKAYFKSLGERKKSRGATYPGEETLSSMLETAFHASCMQEEGRDTSFRLAYVSEHNLSKSRLVFGSDKLIRFTSAREFNLQELRRISPSANPDRTLICVTEGSEGRLEIIGILPCVSDYNPLERGAAGRRTGTIPDLVNIFAEAPGRLALYKGEEAILTWINGAIYPAINIFSDYTSYLKNPLVKKLTSTASQILSETLADLPVKGAKSVTGRLETLTSNMYFRALQRILLSMRSLKHGGTLLIIPDTAQVPSSLSIKYRMAESYDVWYSLKQWAREYRLDIMGGLTGRQQSSLFQRINYYADFIANLTAVDGAVVITDRFRLVGFGCEIKIPSSPIESVELYVKGELTISYIEEVGTRHRSAYRFCDENPDAIACILSQDGTLKVASKDKEKVTAIEIFS